MALKPVDFASIHNFLKHSNVAFLTKDAAIELHRKHFGFVGDTARTGKQHYIDVLTNVWTNDPTGKDKLVHYAKEVLDANVPPETDVPVAEETSVPVRAPAVAAALGSNPAAAQAVATLQALFGGFDEKKVREVVTNEARRVVDQAVEKVNTEIGKTRTEIAKATDTAVMAVKNADSAVEKVQTMLKGIDDAAQAALDRAMTKALPTKVVVQVGKEKAKDVGKQHKNFPDLVKALGAGLNVWMVGPAGSGKSTAAQKAAEALNLRFFHSGKVLSEYQLVGYKDANGVYQATPFYEAYKDGGLFLQDEVDGSAPDALIALNMAIENGEMAFPCGIVKRHANFLIVAAANTWGHGSTADYVGRNRQDGAFIDRFVQLEWPYDEPFEVELSGNAEWARHVQKLRSRAKTKGVKVIISPRATIFGAKLLAAGFSWEDAENMAVKKGMTPDQWASVKN